MAVHDPRKMWFGTLDRMQWVETPQSGADMTPQAWSTSGTNLNGGGYVKHSWGSHKTYTFEWRKTSSLRAAQLMKSYRDGTYGRGLLYFVTPDCYELNILPARWADPSMTLDDEGGSLVYGIYPESVDVTGGAANALPVKGAYYDLAAVDEGYRGDDDALFIPRPDGYTIHMGAFYSTTGSGCVCVAPVADDGTLGTPVTLAELANNATDLVPDEFTTGKGVRVWIGKESSGAGAVTLTALTARLYPSALTPPASFSSGPWVGGMGHSGCAFDGVPTYVPYTGVNGGQAGFAATFREKGDSD